MSNRLLSVLGLFLPHFFAATLSCRKASDKRLFKYFLPYGYMKRRMKYVFRVLVGDKNKDCGVRGIIRAILPYGTVLWWDNGCKAGIATDLTQGQDSFAQNDIYALRSSVDAARKEIVDSSERLELLLLRLINSYGFNPDASVSNRQIP